MSKTIGLIVNSRLLTDAEANKFKSVANKIGTELVFFNSADKMDIDELQKKVKKCDIIYNDEGEYIGIELAKTLEALGGKVIELSKTFYYTEDKWLQYLKCVQNDIPMPKTILLSTDLVSAKKEIDDFGQFPVVLKRIEGCLGQFVDKADTTEEAIGVMKKFWEKGGQDRFPIIAQEFVDSYSYRILTIGGKVEQTVLKKNNGWKATGVTSKQFYKFDIDKKLREILDKLIPVTDLAIAGYDLAKRGDDWLLIEINAIPAYNFFDDEYDEVVEKVLLHLQKIADDRA